MIPARWLLTRWLVRALVIGRDCLQCACWKFTSESLAINSCTVTSNIVKRLRFPRVRLIIFLMTQRSVTKNRKADASASASLELRDFLCFSIYSTSHAFNRVYQPMLKGLGLTYPQFIAMVLLWEQDGQSVSELGRKLFLQSNTLTPMLKRLETLGYVKRSRDPGDERQVHIRLTEAGRKLRLRAWDIAGNVRKATGLQDRQLKDLREGVDALRKALGSKDSR